MSDAPDLLIDNESPQPLSFIDMSGWDDHPAPPRPWAVHDRIPRRQPTLLSGEGAIGKTILLLQLAAAHALGRDWIGTMPELGPVIYFGAEDDADELHRRLTGIAAHYRTRFADLTAGGLHLLSFAGQDALLGSVDRAGLVKPTSLFERLRASALAVRPKTIILDTLADIFAGNENDRSQVRQFVGILRGLAIEADCAVVISAHPSLTGISTGIGTSGSTGWHNSVRARMYFKTAATEKGEEPDKDLRELEFKKNNYGPLADKMFLRWRNGVFVPEPWAGSLEKLAAEQKADQVFLSLLDRFEAQGRNVSDKPTAPSYAPKLFADEKAAKDLKIRRTDLADAMRRLFEDDTIHVVNYGRPSRPYMKIARRPYP